MYIFLVDILKLCSVLPINKAANRISRRSLLQHTVATTFSKIWLFPHVFDKSKNIFIYLS